MSVIRVIHNRENPFVMLNKEALWNPELSLKAIGLWARCMSRPDDWKFNVKELAQSGKEGRRAIDSCIDELIKHGYAMRLEHYEKDDQGHFIGGGVEYIFFEFPANQQEKDHHLEEFKKSFRYCYSGDCRGGDCRNSNLLNKEITKQVPKGTLNENTKKESKPKKEASASPSPSAEASELSKFFFSKIKEIKEDFKEPDLDKWANELDRMLRIDGRDPQKIREIIIWSMGNSFWKGNILSAEKLRKQFDKLEILKQEGERTALLELNRKAAFHLRKKFPEQTKAMVIDSTGVSNKSNGKDVALNMPHEQFKKVLLSIFGW